MLNRDMVNEFFNNNKGVRFKKYLNVSYIENVFYSYNTAIAEKVVNKYGTTVCLVCDTNLSSTTAKHLNLIWKYSNLLIVKIPVRYNGNNMDLCSGVRLLENRLDYYAESNLCRAKNRDNFVENFTELWNLMENFDFPKVANYEKYEQLFYNLQDEEFIQNLKREARRKRRTNVL